MTSVRTRLDTPETALTIGAHPDDAEFGAGATLARWASDGSAITLLVVTDGSKGSWNPDIDQDQLVKTRKTEQLAAANRLGVGRVIHLDHIDGELEYSMDLRLELAEHVRRVRPDVVLTHDPWQKYQLHPDHRVTGMAALDAIVSAREPLALRDVGLPAHRPKTILLWSAEDPDHAEPATDETLDAKMEALMCHMSQGTTTMGGAETSETKRLAFVAKIRAKHSKDGKAFDYSSAELFKRITP